MKLLRITLAAALCLAIPVVALAAVQGSDHDLTGSGEKLCQACHIPHNAQGANLWARSVGTNGFTAVQELCYTCHDGGVTSAGVATAFNAALEQHATVGTDCSGAGACHDVHTQNPNGTGKFTVAGVTVTNNSYCETCHDDTPFTGAEALGDHTAGITHFTGVGFTCNQCHSIHGAIQQTTNPAGLTAPILLADNQTGANYGTFCVSCHNGSAPAAAAAGTGGVAATDVFNYSETVTDGTAWKHPSMSGDTGFGAMGCDTCHDVHDPGVTATQYILTADNPNSTLCIGCHDGSTGPGVGGNSHPLGLPTDISMNNGLTPALPWANQIDEDGTGGADWAGASANNMVCETCHSVHRQGFQTTPSYLLRNNNANNEICQACHTDN